MNEKLYTFTGCVAALRFYINQSAAPDKATALTACAALNDVSESLLDAAGKNVSEDTFKELCGDHVVTVLEAIESIRSTSVPQELNATILELLEYYYTAADALAGGGGDPPLPRTGGGGSSSFGPLIGSV